MEETERRPCVILTESEQRALGERRGVELTSLRGAQLKANWKDLGLLRGSEVGTVFESATRSILVDLFLGQQTGVQAP
jgi:hypothetical protein